MTDTGLFADELSARSENRRMGLPAKIPDTCMQHPAGQEGFLDEPARKGLNEQCRTIRAQAGTTPGNEHHRHTSKDYQPGLQARTASP